VSRVTATPGFLCLDLLRLLPVPVGFFRGALIPAPRGLNVPVVLLFVPVTRMIEISLVVYFDPGTRSDRDRRPGTHFLPFEHSRPRRRNINVDRRRPVRTGDLRDPHVVDVGGRNCDENVLRPAVGNRGEEGGLQFITLDG